MGKVVSGECGGKTPLGQAALHTSDLVPELETASCCLQRPRRWRPALCSHRERSEGRSTVARVTPSVFFLCFTAISCIYRIILVSNYTISAAGPHGQTPAGRGTWSTVDAGIQRSLGRVLGSHGTREIFIPSECSQIRSEIITTTLMEKLKKKRMDL